MVQLKLIKGRSFTGFGVKVTIESPFVTVDDEKEEKLVKSGYFTRVAVVEEKADSDDTDTDKNTDENTEPDSTGDVDIDKDKNAEPDSAPAGDKKTVTKKTAKTKKVDTLGGELDFSEE